MQNRLLPRVAVVLSSFVALAAFACSSAAPAGLESNKDPKAGETADKDGKTKPGTETDTSPTTPTTPLSDNAECGKKTTSQECGDCCSAKSPDADKIAVDAFTSCLCQTPGACKTECAESLCSAGAGEKKEPTEACYTCLDTNGVGDACDANANTACEGDANCKALDACYASACDPIYEKEEAAADGGKAFRQQGGSGGSSSSHQKRVSAAQAKRSAHRQ